MELLERTFKIWDASPSFTRILLRSPKNNVENICENIDIIFWGVCYLNIPFTFRGIQIEHANAAEVKQIMPFIGRELINEQIFVLIAEDRRYYIAAINYTVQENILDIFETSLTL